MKKTFTILSLCFAIAIKAQNPTSCVPNVTQGLVAQFDFTGNANDLSGNANNGTVSGAILTADRFGNPNRAYSFNGTSDFIQVPNSASLQFTANTISISFWVKYNGFAPSGNDNILISKQSGSGATQQGFNVEQGANANGVTILLVSNGGGNFGGSTTGTIALSQTKHVVVVYNNTVSTTYLDGVVANTATANATIGTNTMALLFGMANWINANALNFNGTLDDIRIYNRALTLCDADSLFNMPNPLSVGIAENNSSTKINIYPNPASDKIYLENAERIVKLIFFNLNCQLIKQVKYEKGSIDISDLSSGFYFLKVYDSTESSAAKTFKLIKQ